MAPLALALSLALAGTAGTPVPEGPVGPGVQSSLPPPPIQLYRVAWQRALVALRPLETGPQERGGVAVDPQRRLAFVGTRDGVLHAFRADGSVLWELQGGGGFGPPLVEGDTVYAGSSDGRLYAVAIPTGK